MGDREVNDDSEKGKKDDSSTANVMLEGILGYGRFQKIQVWVLASLICFVGAMNMFQLLFTVTRKSFRCALPRELEQK